MVLPEVTALITNLLMLPVCSCLLLLKYIRIKHLKIPKMKIFEFANSEDSDEAAHNELPHPDLHCLISSL